MPVSARKKKAEREAAPSPQAPPVTTYNCYRMGADAVTKLMWVGGGADGPAAMAVANAYYVARSAQGFQWDLLVGVFNETGVAVGFIGERQ